MSAADVRPDIPILFVDNPGDLEWVKLMVSHRNSQADKIIAAAGKSGIPVGQCVDSAPESDRFLPKSISDSDSGIASESGNSGHAECSS